MFRRFFPGVAIPVLLLGLIMSAGLGWATEPSMVVASPPVAAPVAANPADEANGRPVFAWEPAGHLPQPVSNPALFLRDGRILMVGGNNDDGPLATFREFNPETRAWRRLPSMQLGRFGHGVAMFRDRLYVFGGMAMHRGHLQPVNSVEIFDFASGRWKTGRPLPSPRARFGIAVLRGRIYLAGGEGADGRPLSQLLAFDPFKNTWEEKQGLPSARNRLTMATAADSLFLFGGEGFAGRTLRTVLRYLPDRDRWSEVPSMRLPRKNFAVARLGPLLVVTGGWDEKDGKRVFIGETEILDPRTLRWEDGGKLTTPRDGARMIAAFGRLWLFGGYADGMLDTIETGCWSIPACDWRVDPRQGLQLAFFAEPDPALTLPVRLWRPVPRQLGPAPEGVPEITNIRLDGIRGLGFPLPDRPMAGSYTFYLKFFRYPPGLNHRVSLRRVVDPLLIMESGNRETLDLMLGSSDRLPVKKGFIALGNRSFGASSPFPTLVVPSRPGDPQTFFDDHLPFASLYVRPTTLRPNPGDDASLARWTAGAVATCVHDLVSLYERSFVELPGAAGGSATTRIFLDDAETESRLKSSARLRLIEVPVQPACFTSFRGLPMPLDPRRIFLTGLTLIRDERFRVPSNPLPGAIGDPRFLRETIGSPTVRIFEVGSTVTVPSET